MKRNLIFCIAILCIAALCAAVLTACNPDSPGSNSDNGNNDDGGVFSRNMTMDSFVDTLCSMTNWTATETFTVAKNGESLKILSSSTMKIDVNSRTYEYLKEYKYRMMIPAHMKSVLKRHTDFRKTVLIIRWNKGTMIPITTH